MKTTLRLLALAFISLLTAPALHAQTATQVWASRYDGPANGNDYAVESAVDSAGNVVVTGKSWNGSNDDYYTAKYAAADGALLWEKRYNGTGNGADQASSVAVDSAGNVIVTGTSWGLHTTTNNNEDCYTVKYAAADGALLWEQRYNGPGNNSYDNAYCVALDGAGNVVITGYTDESIRRAYYTAKYAAANGALLWEARYYGPTGISDRPYSVAVDSSGNVAVTGWSFASGSGGDFYTAKYAAADGALLWEQRFIGTGYNSDLVSSVAMDSAGNVAVTGYTSYSDGSGLIYYTAKYAAADGALLWEKRYTSGRFNSGSSVAMDSAGNVVVTGASTPSVSNTAGYHFDYYTAKYAAADGALLWERRYNNGTENIDDFAFSLAVDGAGNVVVTGESQGSGTDFDYYTAKYAAADGALLWEARYNGPANGSDRMSFPYGRKLALTADGGAVVTGQSFNGTNYDYATVRYAPPSPPGEEVQVVIQPGPADGKDAGLGRGGSGTEFRAYHNSGAAQIDAVGQIGDGGQMQRPLIQFDLSVIPPSATVVSATLVIHGAGLGSLNGARATPVEAYRLKVDWEEGNGSGTNGVANWEERKAGLSWSGSGFRSVDKGGYHISDAEIGSLLFSGMQREDGDNQFTLDPVKVQEWVSGAVPNFGFLLRSTNESIGRTEVYFHTSDWATPETRPKLIVTYRPTVALPPVTITQAASAVGTSAATLNGTVNPKGSSTNAYFEWGTDAGYGNTTPVQNTGGGNEASPLSAPLAGLVGHTTYHFRAVAMNGAGTSYGDDMSFTTANSNPVPVPDAILIVTNPTRTINPLANDTDPDGDTPLTVSGATNGAKGTVVFTGNSATYTAVSLGNGTDTFTYTVSDGYGGSAPGIVKVFSVASEAGFYAGFISDVNGVKGASQITMNSSGRLTGRIYFGGLKYSFKGQIDDDGEATIQISRSEQALVLLHLALVPGDAPVFMLGVERHGATEGTGEAERSGTNPPTKRRYTVLLPPDPMEAAAGEIPAGTGYATVSFSAKGRISIAGKMGDGARFSTASAVRTDNTFPFFAPIYGNPRGELYGTMNVRDVPGESDLDGVLTWHKPVQLHPKPLGPPSFTTTTAAIGSLYVQPKPADISKMLSYNATGDAAMSFGEGNLASPLSALIHSGILNPPRIAPPVLDMKFIITAGRFAGHFTHPAKGKTTFGGVVFQKQNLGAGFFLGTDQSGAVTLTPLP